MRPLALDARGLRRRFGGVLAVDGADIAVPGGEVVALLGPSGCGKSTTLRLIAGLDDGEGVIDIDGVRVAGGARPVPVESRKVGLVFQDSVLFPHLNVAANVGFGVRRGDRRRAVSDMLGLLEIGELGDRLPHELSGGQQQRVALARTLASRPALVLLDEPFAHLDASLREQVRADALRALSSTGSSALLVTHDQAEALAVADRLLVMRDGRIRQAGTPAEVYHRPVDRFVAGFIGRASLVPARVEGRSARTPLGVLQIDDGSPMGDRLAVIRPESVVIVPSGDGQEARIDAVTFRGADHLLRVRLADGTAVEVVDRVLRRRDERVCIAVHGPVATVAVDGEDS